MPVILSSAAAMPASPGYTRFNWTSRTKAGMQRGEFDGAIQVQDWLVDWWEANISLPPMQRATAAQWITFLRSLRGPVNTFMLRLPLQWRTSQGANVGTPKTKGDHLAGAQKLWIQGYPASTVNAGIAGDYIELDNYLYELQSTEDADVDGFATYDCFPALRTSPNDGAAIKIADPRGLFRLADVTSSLDLDEASLFGISFKAVEAI